MFLKLEWRGLLSHVAFALTDTDDVLAVTQFLGGETRARPVTCNIYLINVGLLAGRLRIHFSKYDTDIPDILFRYEDDIPDAISRAITDESDLLFKILITRCGITFRITASGASCTVFMNVPLPVITENTPWNVAIHAKGLWT